MRQGDASSPASWTCMPIIMIESQSPKSRSRLPNLQPHGGLIRYGSERIDRLPILEFYVPVKHRMKFCRLLVKGVLACLNDNVLLNNKRDNRVSSPRWRLAQSRRTLCTMARAN